MKNVIVFSGHYDVKNNGSTKEVDENLVKYIDLEGYMVVWIGVGVNKKIKTNLVNRIIDINEEYQILTLITRVLNVLKRSNLISNSNFQYLLFVLYDYFLLKCISKKKISTKESVLVVRNGAATRFVSKFKKTGLKTIIHAQWLHPIFQKKNVEKAYSDLGICFNQKNSKLLKRQKLDFLLADKIWTFSNFGASTFVKEGVLKEKMLIQVLGADKEKFSFVKGEVKEKSVESFKLLFVGNISPEKGVDFFLEYLLTKNKKVTNVTFLGSIETKFKEYFFKKINELCETGLNCEVKSGNSSDEYLEADILVLPSVHDSFGLVVAEALMSGLPVLVSSNSGAFELIERDSQGEVFLCNNMNDFSEKIDILSEKRSYFNKEELSQESQILDWECIYKNFSNKISNELF